MKEKQMVGRSITPEQVRELIAMRAARERQEAFMHIYLLRLWEQVAMELFGNEGNEGSRESDTQQTNERGHTSGAGQRTSH